MKAQTSIGGLRQKRGNEGVRVKVIIQSGVQSIELCMMTGLKCEYNAWSLGHGEILGEGGRSGWGVTFSFTHFP